MRLDPKDVVRAGYDVIATLYEGTGPDSVRSKYLDLAMRCKPVGARALDLGCGTGALATKSLAERYETVGVDISERSIELARSALPHVEFVVSDMSSIDWPAQSFDVVTAFYSMIHLPEGEHGALFQRVGRWLRPSGVFIATMGAGDGATTYSENWLGVPMFWSSPSEAKTRALITRAGLTLRSAVVEVVDEGDREERHLWLVAQHPDD